MQINPNVTMSIGAISAAAGAITLCSTQLTTIFGSGQAATIIAASSMTTTIAGAVILYIGGFSSSKPGPGAPQDPPVVVAATKVADLPPDAHPAEIAATKRAATDAVADHQP